jgi:acyl-CoA reductase-like NAD-dependent aldehyde dehydrogenase
LLAKMSIYALAAGNTVVAKPSSETPLIAIEFAKVLTAAGLPDGCFNVVAGPGVQVGDTLIHHPKIDGIAFTGSTEVGSRIAAIGAAKMRRMQMELGGKNPLIVLGDVDPVKAAHIAAAGAFFHAGQICMASTRIIVEESVKDAFVKALVEKANSLHFGEPEDPKTAYGPVINEGALRKVISHVDGARENGAQILCGGEIVRGLIYKPTVVLEPPRDRGVWREETFGPVASVVGVKDLAEAIALANDSEYGLSAGVLTNDMVRALTAARKIRAGAVHLGTHSFQSDSLSPVGGVGLSGFGRSGGKYSVEHFTELKWISIELGEQPLPF